MSRALASSSRLLANARVACSCKPSLSAFALAARPLSTSSTLRSPPTAASLPPTLPLHQHPNSLSPAPLPESSTSGPSALSLLRSQPSHYISALLLGRRYLLTKDDVLTIPKMKGVKPGDTIALTRILEVGSRDYTLRAASPTNGGGASAGSAVLEANKRDLLVPSMSRSVVNAQGVPRDWQRHPDSLPALEEGVVQATLTVLEHTKGKMFEVEKFKRRKGYRRTLRSKLGFTKLRVGDITIGGGESA